MRFHFSRVDSRFPISAPLQCISVISSRLIRIFTYRSLHDPGRIFLSPSTFCTVHHTGSSPAPDQIPCKFIPHRSPSFRFVFPLNCFYSVATSSLSNFALRVFSRHLNIDFRVLLSHPVFSFRICVLFCRQRLCVFSLTLKATITQFVLIPKFPSQQSPNRFVSLMVLTQCGPGAGSGSAGKTDG